MRFNTGIAAMMEFVNGATKWGDRPRAALEPFVLLLSPYAPHIAEELWQVRALSGRDHACEIALIRGSLSTPRVGGYSLPSDLNGRAFLRPQRSGLSTPGSPHWRSTRVPRCQPPSVSAFAGPLRPISGPGVYQ